MSSFTYYAVAGEGLLQELRYLSRSCLFINLECLETQFLQEIGIQDVEFVVRGVGAEDVEFLMSVSGGVGDLDEAALGVGIESQLLGLRQHF